MAEHRFAPDAEHGMVCSACDVPIHSRTADQPCNAT